MKKDFYAHKFKWPLILALGQFMFGCLSESTRSVRIRTNVGRPTLAISPAVNAFGNVYVASTPVTASFTITNTGDAIATGCTAPALGGTNPGDFAIAVDNCSTNDVAAFTGSCTIGINTTPTTTGARSATLTRTCTNGGTVTTTVNGITVTGVVANVAIDVATRNFGNVVVGLASDSQTFVLTNSGSYPATGCTAPTLGGANAGDFAVANDTCSTNNLAAGATCSFSVSATPLAAGARTATVTRTCTIPGAVSSTANGLTVTGVAARSSFLERQADGAGTNTGLNDARSVVVSPDGKYVYGVGKLDDAIEVFSRNLSTGALTQVSNVSEPTTSGLDGAMSAAISPDGRHLYSAADVSDAIVAFTRNLNTGALTFASSYPNTIGGVTGLNGASDIIVAPDGRAVYALTATDSAITAFSRTASTGALAFVASYPDGIGTTDGLNGATAAAMSPDGRHVYVASTGEDALAVFSRTISTGALTWVQVHKDNIASIDGLDGASDVAVSPDGRSVYVTGLVEDKLAVFSRAANTGVLTYVEVHTDNAAGVDGLDGASSVRVSPDGKFVFVAGSVDNGVAIFSRNQSTGALTYREVILDNNGAIDGLDAVAKIFITQDGRSTYAASSTDDSVVAFTNTLTKVGEPTYVSFVADGQGSVSGLDGSQQVVISPDGKNAYVTALTDDSLEVFTRDPATGLLTWLEKHSDGVLGVDGLNGANGVAVSPDGLNVYVVGEDDDAMATFSRNTVTGALTYTTVDTNAGIGGTGLTDPAHVIVSPDGKNVYVSSHGDDSLSVFTRNADTGALAYSTNVQDGAASVDGLDGAIFSAIAPSWNYLHAVGEVDSGMVVFTRNTDTGALTWLENHLDGVGGITNMGGTTSVSFSPDNNTVYVSGASDDGLVVFTRTVLTGTLTLSTSFSDGVAGVNGLDGAYHVVTSRDGNRVYVTGETDDALAVFSRNLTTGALTYVEAHVNASSGVGYMDAPRRMSLPYDGEHLYISTNSSDACTLFDED